MLGGLRLLDFLLIKVKMVQKVLCTIFIISPILINSCNHSLCCNLYTFYQMQHTSVQVIVFPGGTD